jgi:hypothetical protein
MSRLFDEFQKNNNAFNHRRIAEAAKDQSQFRIAIPLKNSSKLKTNAGGGITLDEDFIRVVEYEYAVRFLESQNTQATANAI